MRKLRILLMLILIIEIGYLFYKETNDIVISVQEIKDSKLAQSLVKLKVIQISDLHICDIGTREKRLVNLINTITPDLILLTGDFVSNNRGIKPCIQILKQISSGCPIIAIFGNNDHSYKKKSIDTQFLLNELQKTGIKILKNESLKLAIRRNQSGINHSLYIVGLDDNYLWFDDIFKAMNNVPQDYPKILLAHSPNIIEKINTKGINLILAGHTHGGQIVLPFIGALYTNPICNAKRKLIAGLYNEDTKLYVNRGIGTVEIPLRLFCKPEITLFKFIAE